MDESIIIKILEKEKEATSIVSKAQKNKEERLKIGLQRLQDDFDDALSEAKAQYDAELASFSEQLDKRLKEDEITYHMMIKRYDDVSDDDIALIVARLLKEL